MDPSPTPSDHPTSNRLGIWLFLAYLAVYAGFVWLAMQNVYGYSAEDAARHAWVPFSQPAIVTVPLGFITLVVVSLLTRKRAPASATA